MLCSQAFSKLRQMLSVIYEEREARRMAAIVMEDAFGWTTAREDRTLSLEEEDQWTAIRERLSNHEPLQYVLGQADFYGLKFLVDQRVLIPRQETEELVHWILENKSLTTGVEPAKPAAKLLDIGTGSGCIAITLKRKWPQLEVHGLDVSAGALGLAKRNAKRHSVEIHFHELDILRFDHRDRLGDYQLIVSNPPYIPPSEKELMGRSVIEFEPAEALFTPEEDPLLFYRKIARFAQLHLTAGGRLFMECNEFRIGAVQTVLKDCHFKNITVRQDLQGKERMICGQR